MTATDIRATIRAAIRDVADFPRPGVQFKDITPVLADATLFRDATELMAAPFRNAGVTLVAAIESRGFLLGAPIALSLGLGLVPIRKPGKLPSRTERLDYALEYGNDALEIHADACDSAARVLIVDDVLATGGTARAACALVERLGATVVGCTFLLELSFLSGGAALGERRRASVICY